MRRVKAWQAYAEVADLVVVEQRGYTLRGEQMELDTPALPLSPRDPAAASTPGVPTPSPSLIDPRQAPVA